MECDSFCCCGLYLQ